MVILSDHLSLWVEIDCLVCVFEVGSMRLRMLGLSLLFLHRICAVICSVVIIQQQPMDCCCPANKQPLYAAQVNQLQSVRPRLQKSKFSFKTTAAPSEHSHSRITHFSVGDDQDHLLQEEMRRLEEEYQRLRQEEAEMDFFENNRIRSLEQEVAFYEREIAQRTRDIDELNQLFRIKMHERQLISQQTQGQNLVVLPLQPVQMVYLPQGYIKAGDETSISSIHGNN